VAILLLPPDTYANFMASARYASGQLANFFFSRNVGYFEEGFSGQPLLHTWSLGVEEQFYLFWPLLISLCFLFFTGKNDGEKGSGEGEVRYQSINRKIAVVMLLLALLSLMVCFSLAESHYNLAFYMFYTRAWEFSIGGLISLRVLPEIRSRVAGSFIGTLGVLLLCYSFLFVKEEYLGRSFLQFGVLLPCIGTALVIWVNCQKSIANRLLATRPPAYIGRISYSLYLYHWPIIIFWKLYSNSDEIGFSASLGIILLAFMLSTASYFFIEQPARKTGLSDRVVLALGGIFIVVFVLLFDRLERYETAPWRITSYVSALSSSPRSSSEGCRKEQRDGLDYFSCNKDGRTPQPIIALLGDSHSENFLYGAMAWAEKNGYDLLFAGLAACPALVGDVRIKSSFGEKHEQQCRERSALITTEILSDPRVEIVLIAMRLDLFHTGLAYTNRKKPMVAFVDQEGHTVADHAEYFRSRLEETIRVIREKGKKVVIIKQVPLFIGAKDCDWQPLIKKIFNREKDCGFDPAFIRKWQQPSIDFIEEFSAIHDVPLLDLTPFFKKPLLDGINLYKDSDHLNEYGKHFLSPSFGRAMDEIMADKKK
jgi:peptidoglycan/LPS O-acetylase OafA/YrhL